VWVWVVADDFNRGWFANSDYEKAVNFLGILGQEAITRGHTKELSVERHQYRPAEATELIAKTDLLMSTCSGVEASVGSTP
jgi:hypothetical protein